MCAAAGRLLGNGSPPGARARPPLGPEAPATGLPGCPPTAGRPRWSRGTVLQNRKETHRSRSGRAARVSSAPGLRRGWRRRVPGAGAWSVRAPSPLRRTQGAGRRAQAVKGVAQGPGIARGPQRCASDCELEREPLHWWTDEQRASGAQRGVYDN